MPLSAAEEAQVVHRAETVDWRFPATSLEAFVARATGLPAWQVGHALSAAAERANVLSALTARRRLLLRSGTIPNYVVHSDAAAGDVVSGLGSYLATLTQAPQPWHAHLLEKDAVARALGNLHHGHDLESVAAALLQAQTGQAFPTRRSRDLGIDAVGWRPLLEIPKWAADGDLSAGLLPGEKAFIVASAKATSRQNQILPPADIRDLIGTWVIHRQSDSRWARALGIRPLSPVQLLLVTTRQLSNESWDLCTSVGVHVWTLPQLVYLVCRHAPANCFSPTGFVVTNFNRWWRIYDATRVTPTTVTAHL